MKSKFKSIYFTPGNVKFLITGLFGRISSLVLMAIRKILSPVTSPHDWVNSALQTVSNVNDKNFMKNVVTILTRYYSLNSLTRVSSI